MAKGRWKLSHQQMAEEAFSVLIHKNRPTRTYTKEALLKSLSDTEVAVDFLKLSLEWDDSANLKVFKAGLLCVIKSRGVTTISEATKMSRLSLYRMLSPKGNPRLSSLMALFRELKLHFWIVDEDFIQRREKVVRPKDIGKGSKSKS